MLSQKDILNEAFQRWIKRLGLGWWSIDIYWYDDSGEIVRVFRQPGGTGLVAAFVDVDWRYAEAAISVNVPALKGMTAEQLERIAVHELIHILVNEMREGEIKHEERVVTTLTNAVFWTVAAIKKGDSNGEPNADIPQETSRDSSGTILL